MERDAIDLKTLNVFTLFSKYFVPTLLGMLGMSAVTAIDGIFVGQGVGSDGIAAVNISIPLLMIFTDVQWLRRFNLLVVNFGQHVSM